MVTIPKTELNKLKKQAKAYQEGAARFFQAFLRDESINDVVADFRDTGEYTDDFLSDLEDGLRKSSLGTEHENKPPAS